jgi:hypothetical protein
LAGDDLSPFLKIGITIERFHELGTLPVWMEKLNKMDRGYEICLDNFLNRIEGIPSRPGELLHLSFLICLDMLYVSKLTVSSFPLGSSEAGVLIWGSNPLSLTNTVPKWSFKILAFS